MGCCTVALLQGVVLMAAIGSAKLGANGARQMKKIAIVVSAFTLAASAHAVAQDHAGTGDYEFMAAFPTRAKIQKAYDDADLNRAVQAYRFFYPSVSVYGLLAGFEPLGAKYNPRRTDCQCRIRCPP